MDDLLDVLSPSPRKAPEVKSALKRDNVSSEFDGLQATVASLCMNLPIIRDVPQSKYYDSTGNEVTDKTKVCKHQVAFPASMRSLVEQLPEDDAVFTLPRPTGMAKEFPFELDPFQVQAISAVSRNESVLVSAHTSAGKTVVAEYAIAQALKNNQKIVYTSPIKALSNQKYFDLCNLYKDDDAIEIGLMTGDTTIYDPLRTQVLVMTTEILRDLLYRGDDTMRNTAWVVFDEVHYMRDAERGVVWEETMIHLPQETRCVFLSATIPNAAQFAGWFCSLHDTRASAATSPAKPATPGLETAPQARLKPCHVIYTEYRPTPLLMYIPTMITSPNGSRKVPELKCIQDETGAFQEEKFKAAMAFLSQSGKESSRPDRMGSGKTDMEQLKMIVRALAHRKVDDNGHRADAMGLPIIVFGFSKQEVENNARDLMKAFRPGPGSRSQLGVTDEDRARIVELYDHAVTQLPEDTRHIESVRAARNIFMAGIGIHHSGLLPTMKELTEMLFGMGLLKVLFATETFAMGLNMPARTVIFSAVSKWDGIQRRLLSSGEYIQMAGRAGRRNVDDFGRVITMISESISDKECRDMIAGQADDLDSSFHVTYSMLIKLISNADEETIDHLLANTFLQFQARARVQAIATELDDLLENSESVQFKASETTRALFAAYERLDSTRAAAQAALTPLLVDKHKAQQVSSNKRDRSHRKGESKLLGRAVFVQQGVHPLGWGLVLSQSRLGDVTVILRTEDGDRTRYSLSSVPLAAIAHVSGWALRTDLDGARDEAAWATLHEKMVRQLFNQCPLEVGQKKHGKCGSDDAQGSLPPFDTVGAGWLKAADTPFKQPTDDLEQAYHDALEEAGDAAREVRRQWGRLCMAEDVDELKAELLAYGEQKRRDARISELAEEVSTCNSVVLMDDVTKKRRVLLDMGYITVGGDIKKKGLFAKEVNTANEVLLTELMFSHILAELDVPQAAALLATLIDETESKDDEPVTSDTVLLEAIAKVQGMAGQVGAAMQKAGVDTSAEEFTKQSVHTACVGLVKDWASGKTLRECLDSPGNTTTAFSYEGTIVRVLRRLVVLLQQLNDACTHVMNLGVGNDVQQKIADVIVAVQRDVVSMESLYTW
ncbi:DSHCT (NUC185) domain [Carpediemonas membranifera]|uniref:DSHCT (NUC185) domain n=1 Tax=Carpediemonas membranifera TaxID=201153 RepID=A0A8J6ARY1_9EUKA|nr:DSHCT (NUC185) domain [Carpediemonas membranifera]|eukprot:KAG9392518.1 DSHCT (NUC185) domain [Carpediemonas membranifera]